MQLQLFQEMSEGHGILFLWRGVRTMRLVAGLRGSNNIPDVGRRAAKRHEAAVERRNEDVIRAFVYASKLRRSRLKLFLGIKNPYLDGPIERWTTEHGRVVTVGRDPLIVFLRLNGARQGFRIESLLQLLDFSLKLRDHLPVCCL
jgi:hypothetical protein